MKKKDSVDYIDLIARSEEERKAEVLDGETAFPLADSGVDYSEEFKKQTGKDFETGEIALQ